MSCTLLKRQTYHSPCVISLLSHLLVAETASFTFELPSPHFYSIDVVCKLQEKEEACHASDFVCTSHEGTCWSMHIHLLQTGDSQMRVGWGNTYLSPHHALGLLLGQQSWKKMWSGVLNQESRFSALLTLAKLPRNGDTQRNLDGFFRQMQGCCFSVERHLFSLCSFKNSFIRFCTLKKNYFSYFFPWVNKCSNIQLLIYFQVQGWTQRRLKGRKQLLPHPDPQGKY